jgi:hypothetical protein
MQVFSLLPFLVWYVLPGLNLITFCIAIPALVLNLHGAAAAFSVDDLVGAAVIALIIGFVMDSVKLYRLTPRYRSQKSAFHARLGTALEIDQEDVGKIFEIVRSDVRAQEPLDRTVELDHSRWVMINHTSKTFFLAAGVWLGVGIVHATGSSSVAYFGLLSTTSLLWKLPLDGAFAITSLVVGLRMQKIAYQVADTSDMNYLIYVRRNAERLKAEITRFLAEGDPNPEG